MAITPILTALGVGGLAVALALQDTLSNLFAGFYVILAGQIRLGDYNKARQQQRMSVSIPVGVSYNSDPDEEERILLDVARGGTDEIPGLLAEPAPAERGRPAE